MQKDPQHRADARRKDCLRERMIELLETLPEPDLRATSRDVLMSHVDHAAFLLELCPELSEIPEDLFLHDIFYPKIGTERLTDCRRFFHEKLKDLMDLPPMERALAVNRWCACNATYRASDGVTRSPLAVYHSGTGRCGEESVFTVCCLRSVGIPARQVYVPWWTHCDDNHAWVEFYADGTWHFFGACEPEPVPDRGWFNAAASRAPLVRARVRFPYEGPAGGKLIGRDPEGYLVYNVTDRYAETSGISVRVTDGSGHPVADASVTFFVTNEAALRPVAHMTTDSEGTVSLDAGFSTFLAEARRDGRVGSVMIRPEERRAGKSQFSLSLSAAAPASDNFTPCGPAPCDPASRGPAPCDPAACDPAPFVDFLTASPAENAAPSLTPEQQREKNEFLAQAAELRQKKEFLFREQAVASVEELSDLTEVAVGELSGLKALALTAGGNAGNLIRFFGTLSADSHAQALNFLESLHPKLLQDMTQEEFSTRFQDKMSCASDIAAAASDASAPASCDAVASAASGSACLHLTTGDVFPGPSPFFSLTHIDEAGNRTPILMMTALKPETEETLRVPQGILEAVTAIRLPGGSQRVRISRLKVGSGETARLRLFGEQIPGDRLPADYPLDRRALCEALEDHGVPTGLIAREALHGTTGHDDTFLLLFEEPGREPSVHAENELAAEADRVRELEKRGFRLIRHDATVPGEQEAAEILARNMFTEPGVFPFLLLVKDGRGMAAHAGYAVGAVSPLISLAEQFLKS